jgi:hypothetical protein
MYTYVCALARPIKSDLLGAGGTFLKGGDRHEFASLGLNLQLFLLSEAQP